MLAQGPLSAWTYVAVEDLNLNRNDDWNDLVFAFLDVATPGVPEPASLALLGASLLGLGLFRRCH